MWSTQMKASKSEEGSWVLSQAMKMGQASA